MELIIAGGRNFENYPLLNDETFTFIDELYAESDKAIQINGIISGTAKGADTLGEQFAEEHHLGLRRMPANWSKHGRSAGFKRNQEMANIGHALIAFWDGKSRGTKHMIDIAERMNLPTKIIRY